MAILEIKSFERIGCDLLIRFESESDAERMERALLVAFPDTEALDIRLSSVDVEEGRKGAGVADVTVEGADIDNVTFAVSDDRFIVRSTDDGKHDLMLADDVALSHAETPEIPITISATDGKANTIVKDVVIEVLPSREVPQADPVEAQPEIELEDEGEDISGRETDCPLPEPQPFDAPLPLDRYTLSYCPKINLDEDVKHNLMYGEFGSVFEGAWGYKDAIEIVDDGTMGGPYLRTHMEKGSHAGTKGLIRGGGFDTRTLYVDRALLRYKVRFKPGFDFVKGGKLPGLMGGDSPSGGSDATDGFSARMMWRENGMGELYLYAMNKQTSHGRSICRGWFHFEPGQEHEIGQEVILNDVGRNNGIVRVWFDGQPVLEQRGIVFRDRDDVRIEGIMDTIFFGGSDDSWGASRDEYVDTGDFKIYV